mmetsp:Transcript_19783/g.49402  ORF Transcript_19783/g.49402 Transcript_19783/m.49402 type:complete len:133 (+) Transcript_19783:946-1344(+)
MSTILQSLHSLASFSRFTLGTSTTPKQRALRAQENISPALIEEFRLTQSEAQRYRGSDFLRGSEKRLWCDRCQSHSHPDNFSQLMRSTPEARRTCLKHRGASLMPTPTREPAPAELSKDRIARCRKFGLLVL